MENTQLHIAAIQMNIHWLNPQANITQIEKVISQLPKVDLIVLPETFTTGFAIDVEGSEESAIDGIGLNWLRSKAIALGCVICGSILVENNGKKANRFYWAFPEGTVKHYDKRHLFRMGKEHDFVAAGQSREIIKIKGFRILPLVCYDLRFPVWSRNQNDYDLVVNVANWPAPRRRIWDTLLQARAIENQAYVIGVNRVGEDGKGTPHSGGTAFYDFTGESLAKAQDDQVEWISISLDLNALSDFRAAFPAYLDADEFRLL